MRKTLFINLTVLAVLLLLFEIVLRIYGLGYDSAAFEPDKTYHHIHKKNYRFVNDNPAEKEYTGIRVYFDEDGCVSNPNENFIFNKGRLKIALFGDSFIEGMQVNFEASITGRLQNSLNGTAEIKNYAVGNYSPILYYLQIKNNPHWVRGKTVFLFLYSNDVSEDSSFFEKAKFNSSGNLIEVNGGKKNIWLNLVRHSYLMRLVRKNYIRLVYWWNHKNSDSGFKTEMYIEEKPLLSQLTKSYISKIDSLSEVYNYQLVLSAIPSKYKTINKLDYDSTDFSIQCKTFAANNNIAFLDLTTAFNNKGKTVPLFFHNDIHFNENGHSVAAIEVLKFISLKRY